jgi:hypothetical protein
VVEAASALLLRFGQAGGDWFGEGLADIRCPVLFTANLADEMQPDMGARMLAV